MDRANSDSDSDVDAAQPRKKRFSEASEEELARIQNGGRRYSENTDRWCEKAFRDWQIANGITDPRNMAERHADQQNLMTFVQELARFILETRTKSGGLYGPRSLEQFVRGAGRVIRRSEEVESVRVGRPYIPFKILSDPRYSLVVNAGDEAVRRSINAGLGREMKKSSTLTFEQERLILGQKLTQLDTPRGVNYRFGYYCLRNFFIRGAKELRNASECDFQLVDLPSGRVLGYIQGESKNYKFSLMKSSGEHHRRPVDCHLPDVIATFERLMDKRFKEWTEKDKLPHPIFLTPLQLFKYDDAVWFSRVPVGENTLSKFMSKMTEQLPGLSGLSFTNKSLRVTGISRMSDAMVPPKEGMGQTGHKSEFAYSKYDASNTVVKNRALQRIINLQGEELPSDSTSLPSYDKIVQEERAKFETEQLLLHNAPTKDPLSVLVAKETSPKHNGPDPTTDSSDVLALSGVKPAEKSSGSITLSTAAADLPSDTKIGSGSSTPSFHHQVDIRENFTNMVPTSVQNSYNQCTINYIFDPAAAVRVLTNLK